MIGIPKSLLVINSLPSSHRLSVSIVLPRLTESTTACDRPSTTMVTVGLEAVAPASSCAFSTVSVEPLWTMRHSRPQLNAEP